MAAADMLSTSKIDAATLEANRDLQPAHLLFNAAQLALQRRRAGEQAKALAGQQAAAATGDSPNSNASSSDPRTGTSAAAGGSSAVGMKGSAPLTAAAPVAGVDAGPSTSAGSDSEPAEVGIDVSSVKKGPYVGQLAYRTPNGSSTALCDGLYLGIVAIEETKPQAFQAAHNVLVQAVNGLKGNPKAERLRARLGFQLAKEHMATDDHLPAASKELLEVTARVARCDAG